jgi:hypothetical protein
VRYDPARVTPQVMLKSVGELGFTATVLSGGAAAPPP